jgi:hypothetical protein
MNTKNIFNLKNIRKLLVLLVIIPSLLSTQAQDTGAQKEKFISDQTMTIKAKSLDPRAVVLKDYLTKYNSPLTDHAQDFVEAADFYGVDWKLVPAIAGVESTFGKRIPGGYNAWGWGVYGDNRIYFQSWRDGIYTLNKGLKEKYINRGLTNPYAMNTIYASSPTWGTKVSYFMNDIEQFSKAQTDEINQLRVLTSQSKFKVAGTSAKLASK